MTRTDNSTLAPCVEPDVSVAMIARDPRLLSRLDGVIAAAGIDCRGRATTVAELPAAASGVEVVVLYDDRGGTALLDMVRAVREVLAGQLLVVVWPASDVADVRKALRAGAAGLILEGELRATLGATVRAVRSGLICVPGPLRAPLESEALSMREKQILGMVVMGFTNADIAARLYLAESTVKSHLSAAYTKLGVKSRREAASMILDPSQGLGPGIFAIAASGSGASRPLPRVVGV